MKIPPFPLETAIPTNAGQSQQMPGLSVEMNDEMNPGERSCAQAVGDQMLKKGGGIFRLLHLNVGSSSVDEEDGKRLPKCAV